MTIPTSPRGWLFQRRSSNASSSMRYPAQEPRIAWALVLPAVLTILLVALFPLAWTVWESLHLHDLRMPWLGKPFIGLDNYVEALGDPRFWGALGHTGFFAVTSVGLELLI